MEHEIDIREKDDLGVIPSLRGKMCRPYWAMNFFLEDFEGLGSQPNQHGGPLGHCGKSPEQLKDG